MPGVGFVLGGAIAAVVDPRMTFLVAGCGVLAIVVVMVPLLGANWLERDARLDSSALDAHDEVVLELIPGGTLGNPKLEEGR
jgi:hypothetical protein